LSGPGRRSGPARPPLAAAPAPGRTAVRRLTVARRTLGPLGRLEDFVPHKLSVVANRVSQSIGRLFEARFGIQIPEWRILMVLYAYGSLVFNEVVARTSMDKARVSRAHRRLADVGLIHTLPDPADGRRLILSLTPRGARTCEAILPEAARTEAWLFEVLTPAEHRQLDVILDKLMSRSEGLAAREDEAGAS
jgi:DNA-binding MarR family transcriptional regulator